MAARPVPCTCLGRAPASVRVKRALAILALTVAMLAGFCSHALADGDPASDYLLSQQVFVLLQSSSAETPATRQLSAEVAAANKAGFPIRVAVISSEYDLGSVYALWHRPQTYARFLGIELSLAYKGRLLVVMPNGFGLNWPGHSTAAAYRMLAKVHVVPGEAGTIAAAQAAVRHLAAAGGAHLLAGKGASTAVSSSAHQNSSSSGSSGIVLLIVVVLALVLSIGLWLRRRVSRVPLKWALPRVAALFALVVAVPVAAVGLLRHGSSTPSKAAAQAVTQEAPFTWSEAQRRAPSFTLTDQNGRPVSPAAYRGRPVIVTFIDPLCRNLCPLEAKVLNEVDERLPVAQRPEIIAVSVDIYADTHADLMQDFGRWSLVPQWQWAVGTPAQLQAVWKRYDAEVEVQTKQIAGHDRPLRHSLGDGLRA